jgi:hypothetical protein
MRNLHKKLSVALVALAAIIGTAAEAQPFCASPLHPPCCSQPCPIFDAGNYAQNATTASQAQSALGEMQNIYSYLIQANQIRQAASNPQFLVSTIGMQLGSQILMPIVTQGLASLNLGAYGGSIDPMTGLSTVNAIQNPSVYTLMSAGGALSANLGEYQGYVSQAQSIYGIASSVLPPLANPGGLISIPSIAMVAPSAAAALGISDFMNGSDIYSYAQLIPALTSNPSGMAGAITTPLAYNAATEIFAYGQRSDNATQYRVQRNRQSMIRDTALDAYALAQNIRVKMQEMTDLPTQIRTASSQSTSLRGDWAANRQAKDALLQQAVLKEQALALLLQLYAARGVANDTSIQSRTNYRQ